MVQPKHHQKAKSNKKPHVKKHGKSVDIGKFSSQLDALGLKIIRVTADGNCFFRALADQLEGNEEEHRKYRHMVVQYISKHREDFEPFIEDGVPFDEYCISMSTDGTWAGHMELQAASLVTRSNICIHRIMEPRWYIRNFNHHARIMHLSYHNEEHYNSVRSKEDPCTGPAKPILIKVDADLSEASRQTKGTSTSKGGLSQCMDDVDSIKLVMAGSGCKDANRIEQILRQVDGDVDVAIECLIAGQVLDDNVAEIDEHLATLIDGNNENGECKWKEESAKANPYESDFLDCDAIRLVPDNNTTKHIDKEVPRNKVCPCGSKKKFKSCCGTANRNPLPESIMKIW